MKRDWLDGKDYERKRHENEQLYTLSLIQTNLSNIKFILHGLSFVGGGL